MGSSWRPRGLMGCPQGHSSLALVSLRMSVELEMTEWLPSGPDAFEAGKFATGAIADTRIIVQM